MRAELHDEYAVPKTESLGILAKNITLLREAMALTGDKLAEYVGSSASHISKLERAKTENPSYFIIRDLARFFGVTTDQLMSVDLSGLSEREQALKRMMDNFTSAEWDVIVAQVDGITRQQASSGMFRNRPTNHL